MAELKRWAIHNRIFILLFALIAIVAYVDTLQINAFYDINTQEAWALYNHWTLPSFITLWLLLMAVPAIVYYLFIKDWSETLGIFIAGGILLFTGLEDILFFIFSNQPMTACMQWFNDLGHPVSKWALWVFGDLCVSPRALITFSVFGVFISYFVFKRFQYMGYRNVRTRIKPKYRPPRRVGRF